MTSEVYAAGKEAKPKDPLCTCNGSGLMPLPRGMTPGFYAFMAPGCIRRDDGTLLMLCSCRSHPPQTEQEGGPHGQDQAG